MSCMALKSLLAALLLAMLTVSPSAAQDLGVIAPGLTGSTLCPLIKSNPQAAIDAVATGAAAAYDQGPQAISNYAQAMGASVGAASANGCIDELFEGVNQAIIKGGFKVEYVTGKALALGVAQGTASDGGKILAKATAVVVCRGGASAQACSRAWNQAVKFDPVNGCAVLVQAFVQARARCAAGKALTEVKAQIWKTPLGYCKAPASTFGDAGNSGSESDNGQGAPSDQTTVQVTHSGKGQTVTKPFLEFHLFKNSAGKQIFIGRRMLAAHNGILSVSKIWGSQARKLKYSYWPYDTTSNAASTAINNGNANGGVYSNSAANARGYGYGWGRTTANSAALATNNGRANGPVVSNSVANADGGRKLMAVSVSSAATAFD